MINEKQVKKLVNAINRVAKGYQCNVTLDEIDLEEESFAITFTDYCGAKAFFKFSICEDDLISLQNRSGWRMTKDPKLMFAAIFI